MELFLIRLINGLTSGLLYGLIAFGLTFIQGMLNIPNFAHGAIFAAGAYIAFTVYSASQSFWLGAVAAFLIAGILGILIERGLVRKLYRGQAEDEHYQLLLLFAVAMVLQELIIVIWGASGQSVLPPSNLLGAVELGSIFYPKYRLFIFALTAILFFVTWLVIEKTKLGATIRASIENREMVQILGIDVRWVYALSFGFGSALAGLGGALSLPIMGVQPFIGFDIIALSFVIVALGGLGNLYGTVAAGLLIGLTQEFATAFSPIASWVAVYAVMATVLIIRPMGLFGSR